MTAMPSTKAELQISGMTCSSCAKRVSTALVAVPGVSAVVVNPARDRAAMTVTPATTTEAVVEAVEKAGYRVVYETIRLQIQGMHCASCAGRVEQALATLPGVRAINVNAGSEQARLSLPQGLVPIELIVQRLKAAGYGASLIRDPGRVKQAGPAAWPWILALCLTLPLLLPMMAALGGFMIMLPNWLALLLAAPIQFGLGARFYRAAWLGLKAGAGNMDQLIVLGTSAAWGLSLANVIEAGAAASLYVESAALIITFVLLGKWLEARARHRTGDAVSALAALRPDSARIRRGAAEHRVPVETLDLGDIILVRPGERVPADGLIQDGRALIDESALTGESLPVERGPGDRLAAGTLALDGALTLAVTALGAQSSLGRIIQLVDAAQSAKPPAHLLVDRISAVFVPCVLVIAIATLAVWVLAGADLATATLHGVAVLVIACPCALGLATPLALVAGLGSAARHGILIKDPACLDLALGVDLIAFDKTGTLTLGQPVLASRIAVPGAESLLLPIAAALQRESEHPLARAVTAALAAEGGAAPASTGFRALPGRGVSALIDGVPYRLGIGDMLDEAGLTPDPALAAAAERLAAEGQGLSWLMQGGPAPRILGVLGFTDNLRPEAPAAIAALHAAGFKTALLTGDTEGSARRIAEACGISETAARLLPADKAAQIRAWQHQGHKIAMVGDGINDAPALAAADLGIAIAGGTDVALAAAQVMILGTEPSRILDLIRLAQRSRRIIRESLGWAFVFNIVGIGLAAAGRLDPGVAALAMAGSSLAVVINAGRLARWPGKTHAG